ncbi:MAG: histidine kinase [Oscillospiraceae bacterium]|nr:histidine kinase [Oscillospiraceae bacterium]
MYNINISTSLAMLLMMSCIAWSCFLRRELFRRQSSYFLYMLLTSLMMLAANATAWIGLANGSFQTYQIFNSITCVCFYIEITLFMYYGHEYISRRTQSSPWFARISLLICVCSAAVWISSNFTDVFYTLDENGMGVPGRLYYLAQVGGYIILLMVIFVIIRYHKVLGSGVTMLYLSFALFPVAAAITRQFWRGMSFMPVMVSLSVMLVYYFIHLQQIVDVREQELRVGKNRVTATLTRLQPPFLYSTLDTIRTLCDTDPATAQQAVSEFAEYFRGNLDSLECDAAISVSRELEHVRHYLRLEQTRLGARLQVHYDIEAVDFLLPPLTLRTLVENAVKYGVTARPEGGVVTIRVGQTSQMYLVTVSTDDGSDPVEDLRPELQSVRDRLWEQCRGSLTVYSAPGVGTSVTVQVPKEKTQAHEKEGIP